MLRFWMTFSACLIFLPHVVLLAADVLFIGIMGMAGEEEGVLSEWEWSWLDAVFAVAVLSVFARMSFLRERLPGVVVKFASGVVFVHPFFFVIFVGWEDGGVSEAWPGLVAFLVASSVLAGFVRLFRSMRGAD